MATSLITVEQLQYVKENYHLHNNKELAALLSISQKQLHGIAKRNNITCGRKKFSKLKILFDDTLEAWYWKGFIMADGHITSNGTLMVSSHPQDSTHLNKLGLLIGKPVKQRLIKTSYKNGEYCFLNCVDSVYGPKIIEQLDIKNPKTYNPPNIDKITNNDNLLAFFIGFFDGDGHFPHDANRPNICKMRIIVHKNWLPALIQLSERLKQMGFSSTSTKLTNRGFATFILYRKENIKKCKNFIKNNNLPHLERKWDLINY